MWPFGKKKKKPVKKAKKLKKYPLTRNEHNFDKGINDIEFFEIMDD